MPGLEQLTNPYDRRAKLYPMVLTLLPVALGITAWSPSSYQIEGVLGSAVILLALASLLTQLARDQGKRREPELFRLWGGRPSDRLFSYAAGGLAPATLARRHQTLTLLDPALTFPKSVAEEIASPTESAAACAAATELLIARTRSRTDFPLLFQENVNYGYRRNLWGMKPAGIVLAILGMIASAVRVGVDIWNDSTPTATAWAGLALSTALLAIWWLRVNASWVKIPADGYARQLTEACDRLNLPA